MINSITIEIESSRTDGSTPPLTEEDISRIARLAGALPASAPQDPVLEAIDQAERTLIPVLESRDDCKQVLEVLRNLRENHKQLLLYKQGWRTPGDE